MVAAAGLTLALFASAAVSCHAQYIAADPGMTQGALSEGDGALAWGLWRADPGATGVGPGRDAYVALQQSGVAPSGWRLNASAWWAEEHGLVMESPDALAPGSYMLAWLNDRPSGFAGAVTLTVTGDRWALDSGATLHDVTHLPCRSARYTPERVSMYACTPDELLAARPPFPVTPGASMPRVPGCATTDYAVLFIHA